MKLKLNLNKWFQSETQIPVEKVMENIPMVAPQLFFQDFFRSRQEYDLIVSILVNQKRCSPSTFLWMDRNAGYKGALVNVIKNIHIQGYLKENKELSVGEIQHICKNTFGVSVKPSTIMHCKPDTLTFIPRSKTFPI